jgi:hypothetical protein
MRLRIHRLAGAAALALASGCAPSPPATRAAPIVSPPIDPAAPAASERPVHIQAFALTDAWEAKLEPKWEIERRRTAGAFVAVKVHDVSPYASSPVTGCVATEAGLVDKVVWGQVLSADHDVDGDGRPDLVLGHTTAIPGRDGGDHLELVVVADRPGGPVLLRVEGYDDQSPWQTIRWAHGQLELAFAADDKLDRQVFAWNGEALASRELVFARVDCSSIPHSRAVNCSVFASAHGKDLTKDLGHMPTLGMAESVEDDSLGYDLAGDGTPFWWIRPLVYTTLPEGDDEGLMNRVLFALRLTPQGWEEVEVPNFTRGTLMDRDGDGLPEVEVEIADVTLVECPRRRGPKSPPDCTPDTFSVSALHAWDGKAFSSRTRKLAGAYAKWKPSDQFSGDCAYHSLEVAARRYLVSRWSGVSEKDALGQLDAAMAKADWKACSPPRKRGDPPPRPQRPWARIRADLLKALSRHLPPG